MKNEVHYYDSETRKYIRTFRHKQHAELELGLYRGAVSDYMRTGIRAKKLFSFVKADVFPVEDKNQHHADAVVESPASLLSEEQIREKHDMFFRILHYVKSIPEGQFTDETSMLRQLELIGKPRYKEAISRPELKEYKGKVDGVVYYGHANSIKKLKSEGILL